MYELEQLNPKIVKDYFDAISKINNTKKPYFILFSVMKSAIHSIVPNKANHIIAPFIKCALQPLRKELDSKYKFRKFDSHKEALDIYYRIEKDLNISQFAEKKEMLELSNYIFDLLEYDLYLEENNETYLFALNKITALVFQHIKALRQWNKIDKNKPVEKNYDIARNTNDTYTKMVAFKLNPIKNELSNPLLNDKYTLLIQKDTIEDFTKYNHITARAINQMSLIKNDLPNDKYIQANSNLSHIIDSDRPIEKKEIYQSFYASIFGIYKFTSKINKKEVPYKTLYNFAQKFSEFVFPELKNWKKPLFTRTKIKKPIKEIAIFNRLSLISFEDKRYKIIKKQDEIEFTEDYLKAVTKFAKKYHHLSKS